MSKEQAKKQKPKWFTLYWITIFALTIIIGFALVILNIVSFQIGILYLVVAIISESLAYYARIKPSSKTTFSLNRIMYILMGLPIGFFLWLILWNTSLNAFGHRINYDFVLVFGSIGICLLIGGFIGDIIGRLRHYKGPEQYQM